MIFSNSAVWVRIPRDVDSFPHWEHDLQKWTTGEVSYKYIWDILQRYLGKNSEEQTYLWDDSDEMHSFQK